MRGERYLCIWYVGAPRPPLPMRGFSVPPPRLRSSHKCLASYCTAPQIPLALPNRHPMTNVRRRSRSVEHLTHQRESDTWAGLFDKWPLKSLLMPQYGLKTQNSEYNISDPLPNCHSAQHLANTEWNSIIYVTTIITTAHAQKLFSIVFFWYLDKRLQLDTSAINRG